MDSSEELENLVSKNKFQAGKNLSESNVCLKRLSIIPEDETVDGDLRVVGFNVKVNGDRAYSFDVGKTKSKSADTFTALDNSRRIFGLNTSASQRDECRGVRKFFKVPNVDEHSLPQDNTTSTKSSKGIKSPVLELKLGNEKEFELYMKSKNDGRDFAAEEERASSRKVCFSEPDPLSCTGPPSCRKSSKEASEVPLKYVIELSSRKVQTEKETESSSAQTTSVEVIPPRSTQEANVQTDRKCDAATSTEHKMVESVKLETDEMPKKQASFQTDTQTVTGSSQTQTAAIFSIDRVYTASTQTDQLEDAATLTDFDIYIVDREKISEKAVDTEDLPYAPLMVAREEKADADDKLRDVICCHCSCNHQNRHECIYECCHLKECKTILQENPVKSNNQPSTSIGTSTSNHCSCCSRKNNSEQNTCDADLKRDIHQQYCSQGRNSSTSSNNAKVVQETVETLEQSDFFQVPETEYGSFGKREKISNKSEVEIVKNLASEWGKMRIIVAIREQVVSKVERAAALKIPVIFQHFLDSFSFSDYSAPKVVINPISINLAVNQSHHLESQAGSKLKPRHGLSSDEGPPNRSQAHLLVCDSTKESSVIVSCLPPMMVIDDTHSQVCLCNSCYSRVQGVMAEKRKKILYPGSETAAFKQEGKVSRVAKEPLATTSPRIKCKKFDYTSSDAWKLYEDRPNDVLSRKIEATDIIHVGDSDSDQSIESADDIDINSACETVNDHLLNLRPVDKDTVRKAAEILHKAWFETAASKHSDAEEVRYFLRYFEEFSNNLLRTLLHSVDNNGNNVFHFAFANNRFDIVEELLRNRFAVELLKKTNKSGNSPLMICAISLPKTESDWSAIRECLEQGDVNSKSLKSGQTPLMNAASCGFHEMVDLLLNAGANPNLQDKDGSTALMYAAEHGHDNCVKTLTRHNKCDPTIKDKDGQTACSIALSNGHKNIAILIHMQALEKRQLLKHPQSPQRYAWTNNESRNRAQMTKSRSPTIHSSGVH